MFATRLSSRILIPSLGAVLVVAGCGGGENESGTSAKSEQIVIRTRVNIAPTPGAEPIATGEVLDGSTLGDSPFCVGGRIRDAHASPDPEVFLIARTITCADGEVRIDFSPELSQTLTQTGSWTIVSGTGVYEGIEGSGELKVINEPGPTAPARETYTGTVSR